MNTTRFSPGIGAGISVLSLPYRRRPPQSLSNRRCAAICFSRSDVWAHARPLRSIAPHARAAASGFTRPLYLTGCEADAYDGCICFRDRHTIRSMKRLTLAMAGSVFFANLFAQAVQPPKTHLKVGDTAPDFSLNATTGGKVTLSEFRGKSNVVLAFFPAAFTGG